MGKVSDLIKQLLDQIFHQQAGALDVCLIDSGVGVAGVVTYVFQRVERFVVWPQPILESLNPVSQLDLPLFPAIRVEAGIFILSSSSSRAMRMEFSAALPLMGSKDAASFSWHFTSSGQSSGRLKTGSGGLKDLAL